MPRPIRIIISFFCFCLAVLLVFTVYAFKNAKQTDTVEEPQADPPYDAGEIVFNKRNFSYDGSPEDISLDGDVLTILRGGVYRLSGTLTEGRIKVASTDGSPVRLILGGVTLSSSYGAVIETDSRTFLTVEAQKGTVNILSSTLSKSRYEHLPSACIIFRGSAEFLGEGNITVNSSADCGILALSDLSVNISQLTVSAKGKGIFVRDSFNMSDGRLTLKDTPIGIAAGSGEATAGSISILGGTLTALCKEIALMAERNITISGGNGGIDSPVIYQCSRKENGKTVAGEIKVSANGYPSATQK